MKLDALAEMERLELKFYSCLFILSILICIKEKSLSQSLRWMEWATRGLEVALCWEMGSILNP
jgi:hypothetical protein